MQVNCDFNVELLLWDESDACLSPSKSKLNLPD